MRYEQMRVSTDVWTKAGAVAKAMGLKNERQAIEAVFRVAADAYMQGAIITSPVAPGTAQPLAQPLAQPVSSPPIDDIDAAADIDALMAI